MALPQDILEKIVEDVSKNTDVLASLSLTCQAFVDPCRRHLFRLLRISTSTKAVGYQRLSDLLGLIEKNPRLTHHFRLLSLAVGPHDLQLNDTSHLVPDVLHKTRLYTVLPLLLGAAEDRTSLS